MGFKPLVFYLLDARRHYPLSATCDRRGSGADGERPVGSGSGVAEEERRRGEGPSSRLS